MLAIIAAGIAGYFVLPSVLSAAGAAAGAVAQSKAQEKQAEAYRRLKEAE